MRLLCVIPSLIGGGAEKQMCLLLKFLNERGIVPYVMTFHKDQSAYITDLNIVRYNIISNYKFIRNIKLGLMMLRLRPSVVLSYCSDANFLAAIYKCVAPWCRVVVSERNTIQEPLSRYVKCLYTLYRIVNKIVSNSFSQAEKLQQLYPCLQKKIEVITNYTEIPIHSEAEMSMVSTTVRIVIAARYHPQKNLLNFIEALHLLQHDKECPKFECLWYGCKGISDYYEKGLQKISEYQLDNVKLYDFSSDISNIQRAADVICLPSFYEGFSNSLSEGICMGKPILASNTSDNKLFCREGVNGYMFDPHDISDIASAIKKMLLAKEHYVDFARNSKIIAQTLFDKEKFVKAYLRILFDKA